MAICISLKTANDQKKLLQKQNEIALYETRINSIHKFKDISYSIYFCLEYSSNAEEFMTRFKYSLGITDDNEKEKADLFIHNTREAIRIKYIFDEDISEILNEWYQIANTVFIKLYSLFIKCKVARRGY